jgi:hypothetical protein
VSEIKLPLLVDHQQKVDELVFPQLTAIQALFKKNFK